MVYTFWKQGELDANPDNGDGFGSPVILSESRITGTTRVNGMSFAYTNNVAPTSGYHILTVNYYDDYSFPAAPASVPASVGDGDSAVYYNNSTKKPIGLPTGGLVRTLQKSTNYNSTNSYVFYDDKASPVRERSAMHDGGFTQTDTKYNFIGNPLYTLTQHRVNAADQTITIKDLYSYNDQDRLIAHGHKINSQAIQSISRSMYNFQGELIEKKVGGSIGIGGDDFLQKVDYRYNIRGWLTDINNINSLSEPNAPQDLFAFKMNYNTVEDDMDGLVQLNIFTTL